MRARFWETGAQTTGWFFGLLIHQLGQGPPFPFNSLGGPLGFGNFSPLDWPNPRNWIQRLIFFPPGILWRRESFPQGLGILTAIPGGKSPATRLFSFSRAFLAQDAIKPSGFFPLPVTPDQRNGFNSTSQKFSTLFTALFLARGFNFPGGPVRVIWAFL